MYSIKVQSKLCSRKRLLLSKGRSVREVPQSGTIKKGVYRMKNMRKLLSTIMALAMVATLLPAVTVEANAAVATEAELFAAIEAAPAEGAVIDLEGKTIEVAEAHEIVDKKVTIKNGTINAATYWKVLGTSELTLEAVTFNSSSYGFNINDSSDGLDKSAKVTLGAGTKVISVKQSFRIYASGVLTVDGGEIECTSTAVAIAPNAGSTINLISGSIVGAGAAAIQGGGCTLNMTGGKLETKSSKGRTIIVTYHKTPELNGPFVMNISGGTIAGGVIRSAVEASEFPVTLNVSGDAVIEGYNEMAIDQLTSHDKYFTSASITGGTFNGYVALPQNDALAGCITGGTFKYAPFDIHIKAGYAYVDGKVVSNLCDGKPGSCASSHLTDVPTTHDNHSEIDYVVSKGLMAGFGGNVFAPDTKMDWSMAVQVLYNMAGQPAVTFKAPFSDVTAANWYANAVQWAVDNGIIEAGSTFGPTADISAAEFGTILKFYGQNVKKADISAWAGVGSTAATVTRGQAAKMLQGFHSICG